MSLTKRYLESLPQAEQDAILGDRAQEEEWFARVDEWDDAAENEPDELPDDDVYRGEGDLECSTEWARTLIEEEDGLIYELKPGLKRCEYVLRSGNQCELAKGHVGRHAYETGDDDGFIEQDDEEANDPPVRCRICRVTWPISEMNTNGECPDCQLEATRPRRYS